MKKLVILILAAFLLTSCNSKEPDVGLSDPTTTPDITEASEQIACYMGDIISFESEAEVLEYAESMNFYSPNGGRSPYLPSHYYKFKNLPQGRAIICIRFDIDDVSVAYDNLDDGFGPSITYFPNYLYDIETHRFWVNRRFPDESYIFDVESIKYYVWKGMGGEIPVWRAEWANSDGYNMRAQFPYRFTAEEVLGYISDLERVDVPMPEIIEEPEAGYRYVGDFVEFYSEEAIFEYVQNEDSDVMSAHSADNGSSSDLHSHYYKLKNPPQGVEANHISFGSNDVTVRYDNDKNNADEAPLWIIYNTYKLSSDEIDLFLVNLRFRVEPYIYEFEGLDYYMYKGQIEDFYKGAMRKTLAWVTEWVNADSYYMRAYFPYSFTAEEVLGYISDLERVEIAVPKAGDEVD